VPVDAASPSRHPFLRLALLVVLAALGLVAVPAAQADDLIQLNGDLPVTLQGGVSYGLLYLDGTVRLAGDTAITATDVFIGPDAQLQTCFIVNANDCTNGRSLSITASGGVAISPAINLSGGTGTNRQGGSLTIHAARVVLGGGVETAGTAAGSGAITIDAAGLVVTQNLHAPGAAIFVHGAGGVSIGGDITTSAIGDAAVMDGGAVDLASSGGDVSVLGSIASAGRDVPGAGAIVGGNAGPVTIVAGEVRVSGGIDSSAGRGVDGSAGQAGAIRIPARGSIVASGPVTASGDVSTSGYGSDGAAITMTAAGSLAAGSVSSTGGSSTSLASGAGGSVALSAGAALTAGAINTTGGRAGGTVSITGDRVTTGSITTLGEKLSAPGASVTLSSQSALIVGGPVDSSGAPGSSGNPGGAGGPMLISTHGPLTLGGRLRSEGGAGGSGAAAGANGGNGGSIELVVQSIASSTGVLSGGGDGGNSGVQNGPQGRGGDGGRVRVWAQVPSLILLQLVDSAGGQGTPNGTDGPQKDEAAPTALSITKTHTLAFTANAPDAEGYRVFQSIAGAPATVILTTKASGVALPKVAPCVSVAYSLAAFHTGVGWQSDPVGPVGVMDPPSATQACTDAPQVTLGVRKLKKKLHPLKKKKWHVGIRFLADGMGNATVVLSRKGKKLVTAVKPLAATRRNVTVTLTIPKKLRKAGKFTVTVTGTAPLGKARSKSTLTLEVTK
jgi:hypothetical protein